MRTVVKYERRFVVARGTEHAANDVMHQLAAVLRASGLADRYGLYVERYSGPLRWAVYLVDRTPAAPAPGPWERALMCLALAG
ncbi:hypothetical protein [Streptomyces sp. NPDC047315]|uniref:hypothetical protein n=1 Tax=Streptomyces sp. NPDC047315 TaxID=3155142 RepID=UPI0033F177BC